MKFVESQGRSLYVEEESEKVIKHSETRKKRRK